jgi:GNAT superfamily N-acetyltransferase
MPAVESFSRALDAAWDAGAAVRFSAPEGEIELARGSEKSERETLCIFSVVVYKAWRRQGVVARLLREAAARASTIIVCCVQTYILDAYLERVELAGARFARVGSDWVWTWPS